MLSTLLSILALALSTIALCRRPKLPLEIACQKITLLNADDTLATQIEPGLVMLLKPGAGNVAMSVREGFPGVAGNGKSGGYFALLAESTDGPVLDIKSGCDQTRLLASGVDAGNTVESQPPQQPAADRKLLEPLRPLGWESKSEALGIKLYVPPDDEGDADEPASAESTIPAA